MRHNKKNIRASVEHPLLLIQLMFLVNRRTQLTSTFPLHRCSRNIALLVNVGFCS